MAKSLGTKQKKDTFATLGHKVIQNYEKYIAPNKDLVPCVLVATGTFCPVHRMHIVNMELSKQCVESKNSQYRVIGGFISPTHDEYCSYKVGNEFYISSVHRNKMISLAVQDNDWIGLSPWHTQQESMVSINDEVGHIEKMIHSLFRTNDAHQRFVIFYVCGSDLANKCRFYKGFDSYGVVIIQRDDCLTSPDDVRPFVQPPVYLVDIPKQYDAIKNVSSTQLRYYINQGHLFGDLAAEQVQQYMIEHNILGASKLKSLLQQTQDIKLSPETDASDEEKENTQNDLDQDIETQTNNQSKETQNLKGKAAASMGTEFTDLNKKTLF